MPKKEGIVYLRAFSEKAGVGGGEVVVKENQRASATAKGINEAPREICDLSFTRAACFEAASCLGERAYAESIKRRMLEKPGE